MASALCWPSLWQSFANWWLALPLISIIAHPKHTYSGLLWENKGDNVCTPWALSPAAREFTSTPKYFIFPLPCSLFPHQLLLPRGWALGYSFFPPVLNLAVSPLPISLWTCSRSSYPKNKPTNKMHPCLKPFIQEFIRPEWSWSSPYPLSPSPISTHHPPQTCLCALSYFLPYCLCLYRSLCLEHLPLLTSPLFQYSVQLTFPAGSLVWQPSLSAFKLSRIPPCMCILLCRQPAIPSLHYSKTVYFYVSFPLGLHLAGQGLVYPYLIGFPAPGTW